MASVETAPSKEVITTVDGTPLKVSLARALRREKLRAALLVAPLFLYITITFFFPIGDMLFRGVEDPIVSSYLPNTAKELQRWDDTTNELPDEQTFAALVADVSAGAEDKLITRVGKRLNYEKPGMSSLFRKSQRRLPRIEEGGGGAWRT